MRTSHQLIRHVRQQLRQGLRRRLSHGRYDVVCPVQNAFDLHQVWPKAELVVTPASGHSAFEAENVDALVRATDRFA